MRGLLHTVACENRMLKEGDHACTCAPGCGVNVKIPVMGEVETMGGERWWYTAKSLEAKIPGVS